MTRSLPPAAEPMPDEFNADSGNYAPEAPPPNPLLKLHQFLSGRYHWAISLGATFAIVGGTLGFLLAKPQYQSIGEIHIKPVLNKILYTTEQSNVMPMFDAYVDTQAALMQSQRNIMLAMQSPDWQAAVKKSHSTDDLSTFADSLVVTHPAHTELLQIAFTDHDPTLAPVAVKAVIDAYQKISGESDADNLTQRMQVLEDRRTTLTNQLKSLNERIVAIANEFGTDDLERIFQPKLTELNTLEASIRQTEISLAYAQATEKSAATTMPASAQSAASATLRDPILQRLTSQRDQQAALVARLQSHYGDSYPQVVDAKTTLRLLDGQIAARSHVDTTADAVPALASSPLTGAEAAVDPTNRPLSVNEAQLRLKELKTVRDRAKTELLDIGRKELQIRQLKSEIDFNQRSLDEVKSRIDALNVESAVSGRTVVISTGDIPLKPLSAKKRLAAIFGGSFGGLALGVGLIALIGAFDRRLKSVSEAHSFFDRTNRILGVLPALPEDLGDPEQASRAAFCVHHIRTLLQVGNTSSSRPVYAITSASPAEGKTSLVHSLGLSYAATGAKTLVIDFDLVGAGLTALVNAIARRKIGDLLVRKGLLSAGQLRDALELSRTSGKRLGETLISSGAISQGDLDEALAVQKESNLGLLDVLDGESLENCIINAGTPNFFILPTGNIGAQHAGHVSIHAVTHIVRAAQELFDVVLIDTGPILGSLEACIVSAVCDEVIVLVSRGQERPMIEKTFARLADCGARISGIVFNRAMERDIELSGYSSSYASQTFRIDSDFAGTRTNGKSHRFGPVARAVASVGASPESLEGGK